MDVMPMEEPRFTRKIGKQGGSLSVGIPAELTRKLNLSKGDEVEMAVANDGGEIVIRKKKTTLPEGIDEEFLRILNGVIDDYEESFWELKDR